MELLSREPLSFGKGTNSILDLMARIEETFNLLEIDTFSAGRELPITSISDGIDSKLRTITDLLLDDVYEKTKLLSPREETKVQALQKPKSPFLRYDVAGTLKSVVFSPRCVDFIVPRIETLSFPLVSNPLVEKVQDIRYSLGGRHVLWPRGMESIKSGVNFLDNQSSISDWELMISSIKESKGAIIIHIEETERSFLGYSWLMAL